jgi:hypothetical protein
MNIGAKLTQLGGTRTVCQATRQRAAGAPQADLAIVSRERPHFGTFEKSRDVRLVVAVAGPDTKMLFSRRIAASTQASSLLKGDGLLHHNFARLETIPARGRRVLPCYNQSGSQLRR